MRVPFDVPAGTTAVRVKYCYDQPEVAGAQRQAHAGPRHLRPARLPRLGRLQPPGRDAVGRRGHARVPARPDPARHLARRARPGRDRRRRPGDVDGRSAGGSRSSSRRRRSARPTSRRSTARSRRARRPAGTRATCTCTPSTRRSGDASMAETFRYAFGPAKLDFITLTDYVTDSAWGEIGRYAKRYPRNLVGRSAEIITYRGHTNNQLSGRYVDYRTGPVYDLRPDGGVTQTRAAQPASRDLPRRPPRRRLHADQPPDDLPVVEPAVRDALPRLPVGLHATPRPATATSTRSRSTPGPQRIGEAPNPFTSTAIDFYERALAARRPRGGGRLERLPPRGRGARGPDAVAGRHRRHRRPREAAVRARRALRREGGPHLREARRLEGPGPALHRPRRRAAPRSSATRARQAPEAARPARRAPASCSSSATAA